MDRTTVIMLAWLAAAVLLAWIGERSLATAMIAITAAHLNNGPPPQMPRRG